MPEIMATGTTPVMQPIGSFSGVIPSVGQPIALFSGVLPSMGTNQGKGLFSGQLPTPIALGSLNAARTTIQLGQTKPSVSIIPQNLNAQPMANNPINRTIPMVVAKPLNKTEPEVVTAPLNETKPLNATNPMNTTQPLNVTQPLNTTMS
jgi:hypothetical protein